MKTTFPMILAKTEELLGITPLFESANLEYDTQRLSALKRGCHMENSCLFTTESSKLATIPVSRWPRQILCVANAGIPDTTGFGGNIAVFPISVSRVALSEAASCACAYYGRWCRQLLDLVYEGRGPDEIVDYAHEYFLNPILIYDSSLKVLAYTKNEDVGEQLWNNTVRNRTVTDMDAAEATELKKYVELTDSHPRPFRHCAPALARPFYSCNIMLRGKRVGMVDVMEKNHPLTKCELDMLENFCYAMSFELQRDNALRENLGSTYQLLLSDLLKGGITSREALMSRMAAVRWDVYGHLRVLTFVPVNTYMTDSEFRFVYENLIHSNIRGKGILFDGSIVLIISSGNPQVLSESEITALSQFCIKSGLRCGASDVYSDILQSHLMYPRAKLALTYSTDSLTLFENVRFTNLLNHCASYPKMEEIIHPAIKKLADADASDQSEYLETLRIYFECGHNQVAAAKHLNIHRTTMAYRLQKISEYAELDFQNYEDILHLQLSIALRDYMEKI